jgi:hypothetical protein
VEDEMAWVGFASRVDDEAVLVTLEPGELARVDCEDSPDVRPPEWLRTSTKSAELVERDVCLGFSSLYDARRVAIQEYAKEGDRG